MARSAPGSSSAIGILEETANLLRQAPLATFVCHWSGSVPFALAVLLFWNDLSQFRAADSTCVADSLLLAVLLIWMSCCRAVFAGRLRRQLSGSPDAPWTPGRIGTLAANQAFLGATKLLAIPLASLVIFPLGGAVAFYRYAAALAGRGDLDAVAIATRAARLATRDSRLNWAILPLLTLLQLVVAANVALALVLLPQLVRILTGFESTFSRGGLYVIQNPLFLLLVCVASWLLFDPFLQAAYCVLCFRAESMETGEDLRSALRRVRHAAPALTAALAIFAALILAAVPARAADVPSALPRRSQPVAAPAPFRSQELAAALALPAEVRGANAGSVRAGATPALPRSPELTAVLAAAATAPADVRAPYAGPALSAAQAAPATTAPAIPRAQLEAAIHKTVQSHEYDWRLPPDARPSAAQPSWLANAANRVMDGFKAAARAVGHAIEALLDWIFGKLTVPRSEGGAAPAIALHWSVYLLIAVIVGLALWFAWARRRLGRARPKPAAADVVAAVLLDAEDLTPDRLPEDRWLEMADECLRDQNFRFAVRALYLANLAWLGQQELIAIHPGKTNREYEVELRRKARGATEARELFAGNIAAFERAWYGLYDVAVEDAVEFRARNSRMKALLAPREVAA